MLRIHGVLVGQIPSLSLLIASPLPYYTVSFLYAFFRIDSFCTYSLLDLFLFFFFDWGPVRPIVRRGGADWDGWSSYRDRRECGKHYIIL